MGRTLGPLLFEPIYRPKIWGGRALAQLFGRTLPGSEPIGESWELADLDEGVSVVAAGPARGLSLRQCVAEWGGDLLGRAPLHAGRFPLLIKFLDARQPLSVQVHPDDETAAAIGGGARSKDEAFYVIAAEPHGCIYHGLKPGVDAAALRTVAANGSIEPLLNRVPVKPGQVYYVPPGTLHALGAGVVVAEIETPSDTTYRLYDWGRTRPAGDSGLHVDLALRSLRMSPPPVAPRSHVAGLFTTVTRLVRSPSFQIELVRFVAGMEMEIPYAEMVAWVVLSGRGQVRYARDQAQPFSAGNVLLLPAALPDGRLVTETECTWLEVSVPAPSDLAGYDRPSAAALRATAPSPTATVDVNVRIAGEP